MSETPVFTGDFGFSRPYELRNSGWDGGLYAFMRRVLATEHGGAIYRKQAMIEPIFVFPERRARRYEPRGAILKHER